MLKKKRLKTNEIDHPRSQSGVQDEYSKNKVIEKDDQNSVNDDHNANFSTIGGNQKYYEENENIK